MIEDKIMQKIDPNSQEMSESTRYEPNGHLASVIANHITGMGFYYNGYLNEPGSDETGIPVHLNVELNGDDVEVLNSPNVMYCFIHADNIDYKVETADDSIYSYANFSEILKANHLVKINPKAWRDDRNLYLLKINLNSGLIGRYDPATGRFRNQEVIWNSSTPEEVVELLLTKDYLESYFRAELSSLESYVSFATQEMVSKPEPETI